MTEDEAKLKTCPFTFSVPEVREANDHVREAGPWNCVGSGCMAWKWQSIEYENGDPLPIGTAPADPGWEMDGTTWCCGGEYGTGERRQRWRRPLPRSGSCALIYAS